MGKTETKNKYSTYFSSRGVNPEMYREARLPYYVLEVLGGDRNLKILDFGCGYGQNLNAFMNEGFLNVTGLDISNEAIKYCRERGFKVIRADVRDYSGEKFDFIIMSHVLEHLPKEDIIPMLKHIKNNLLNKGGRLCVMVPNAQSDVGCYWAYEDFTHYTLFTAGSLLYVLREAGFENIEILDQYGINGNKGVKRLVRKILLKIYMMNKDFWNKVTGSYYHAPSPRVYTWEIKCLAYNQ